VVEGQEGIRQRADSGSSSLLAPRNEDLVERDGVKKFGPLFPTGPDQYLSPVAEVVLERNTIADAPSALDFETGRTYEYHEGIEFGGPEKQRWLSSTKWEIKKGIDLEAGEGRDLHVWLIDNSRWDSLDAEVRSNKPLAIGREEYSMWTLGNKLKAEQTKTYLFTTREGSRGVLRVHRSPDEARPRFEYRLWNRKTNAVVARRPPPPAKQGEWQPQKIVILQEPDFGNRCLFRFDRGESQELPASIFVPEAPPKMAELLKTHGAIFEHERIAKWARVRGIDIASQRSRIMRSDGGDAGPTEEMDLTLLDARTAQVTPEAFDDLTVARAKEILGRSPEFYQLPYLMASSESERPQATYVFETKSGHIRLITILHVRNDLSSISFQYKLAGGDRKTVTATH
jgi:hypothetical protein